MEHDLSRFELCDWEAFVGHQVLLYIHVWDGVSIDIDYHAQTETIKVTPGTELWKRCEHLWVDDIKAEKNQIALYVSMTEKEYYELTGVKTRTY